MQMKIAKEEKESKGNNGKKGKKKLENGAWAQKMLAIFFLTR